MTVQVELLTAGAVAAQPDVRPDIPQYSQARALTDNFNFDDGPDMRWTWKSQFFRIGSADAGASVNVTPGLGLEFTPNSGSPFWVMYNTWLLGWMNLLPQNQLAQIGIYNLPTTGGLVHVGTNASLNPTNRGAGFGAYALIAEATSTPGIANLWISLLRFGATQLSTISVNPDSPQRIDLLNCGTTVSTLENGGTRLSLQSLWKTDHWELAAYVAQRFYFFETEVPMWEFRGSINDDQLRTGVPIFGVANVSGSSAVINIDDWHGGFEPHPWPWPLTAPLVTAEHPDAAYIVRKAYSPFTGQRPVFE